MLSMLRNSALRVSGLSTVRPAVLQTPMGYAGLLKPAFLVNNDATSPVNPIGQLRWATSKSAGSTKNGRDSQPKFLGVKKYGGHFVIPGNIIVRQRGQRFGIVEGTDTVGMGKDHTIFAKKPGYVKFWKHTLKGKSYVEIVKTPPFAKLPDGSPAPVEKYPLVKIKPWEYESLARIIDSGENVLMSDEISNKLEQYRAAAAAKRSSGGQGPNSPLVRRAAQ